jgi:hypothetical protein
MKVNDQWLFKLIAQIVICCVCAILAIYYMVEANNTTLTHYFLILFFTFITIVYISMIHKNFNNGPAYYQYFLVPKEAIEQHIFENIIVLAHQGKAFIFDSKIQEIADLPGVYAKLYYKLNKEQCPQWHLDPYTQLMRMKGINNDS